MYAPYAYEGACACVRPPEHIYYGPLVVDILTVACVVTLLGMRDVPVFLAFVAACLTGAFFFVAADLSGAFFPVL
jgi:hypothetical protein